MTTFCSQFACAVKSGHPGQLLRVVQHAAQHLGGQLPCEGVLLADVNGFTDAGSAAGLLVDSLIVRVRPSTFTVTIMLDDEERQTVHRGCARRLSGHGERTMRQWLTSLATMPESDEYPDLYGMGNPVRELENRVTKLLDKPAARFVVKGVIAQQAALRSWTDAAGIATVGLHPRSHLDLDELGAFERLHSLRAVRLGDHGPFGVGELEAVGEPLGVVTVELPLRNAGFKLPDADGTRHA